MEPASPLQEESSDGDGDGVAQQTAWGVSSGPLPPPSDVPTAASLLQPEDSSSALIEPGSHVTHRHSQGLPYQQQQQSQMSHPQATSQQHHFASLDFETGLPSFPSDAAFSIPEPDLQQPAEADPGSGSGLTFDLPAPPSPRLPAASRAADASQPAALLTQPAAPAAGPLPAPALPPLRLGRVSAPLPTLRTSHAAGASAPGSPRPPGSARAAALAAEAGPASMPVSPRSMHGLVRTSLLPAAADRQAVMHVGELMGAEAEAGEASPLQPGSAHAYSLPASPRRQAAAAQAPSQPQQPGSWQPQRMLKHTVSDSGRTRVGASRLGGRLDGSGTAGSSGGGSGAVRRASFGGLAQPVPALAGLATLLKPPSPGKISPLASAGNSPEPAELADVPSEAAQEAHLAAGQAAGMASGPVQGQALGNASGAAAAELSLLPPLPPLDSLPRPAHQLGKPAEGLAEAGGSAAALPASEAAPSEAPAAAAQQLPAGWPAPPSPPTAAGPAPPTAREPLRSFSAALPSHEELFGAPGMPVGSPPSHPQFGRSRAQVPAAGAGMVAAAAAALPGTAVKPWQAGALLLRRSMSTPFTGIAEQLEAAGDAAPHARAAGNDGRAQGGSAHSSPPPLHGAASSQSLHWSEDVLGEARTRLVAGKAEAGARGRVFLTCRT